MRNKKLGISIALGLIFSTAFGQEDYVVSVKGDTLYGKIIFQQIGKIEQVQVKGKKRQVLSAIQVRMAKVNDKEYRPMQFSGSIQMMEVLKDGYLSLLAFQPPGIMNYDGRLLALRSGRILEVPTIGFKKRVSEFLNDDEDLASQIKDGDLDRKDLNKIIDRYNSYVEGNTKVENKRIETEIKQTPKLDLISEIAGVVENSNFDSKTEVLEMLNELKDKISNNKTIPQYLSNALRENLKSKPELIEKLETVLK